MTIETKYSLVLISRQYKKVLLTGKMRTLEKRLKRLDYWNMHIIKNYK